MNDEVIQKFNELRENSPALGKIPCLAVAVRGKKLNKIRIRKYLLKLCVAEEDYFKKETRVIINWLWRVSNGKTESR